MSNDFSSRGAPRFWLVLVLSACFWGAEYLQRDLWEPDEARFAYVAREMRSDGHWLVPHRSGVYYAHKPPLMFWLNNAFATLNQGHINQVTSRMPTFLGTVLTLWATGQIAAQLFSGNAGWLAPMLLATSILFRIVSGMGQIDGLLCGLQMLAFWLLLRQASPGSRPRLIVITGAYLAMGLAVLAKGPVAVIVPLGSWLAFSAVTAPRRNLRQWHFLWGPFVAALPVLLWLGAIVFFNVAPDGYFDELLFKQNIGRATGDFAKGHTKPFWYFAEYVLIDFLPWTLLFPAALMALKRHLKDKREGRGVLAWALFVIIFFSLSVTKRNLYILMAYPAAAILLAAGWERIDSISRRFRTVSENCLAGFFLLLGIGLIATPFVVTVTHIPVPINTVVLIPGGLVWSVSAFALWRRKNKPPTQWLTTAVIGFALGFWILTLFAYPALNQIKAPHELAEIADEYLPSGQDLLLYGINGEIQAYYCHARGRTEWLPEGLARAIQHQKRGLLVLRDRDWQQIANIPGVASGIKGKYSMGSKRFIWVAFDVTASDRHNTKVLPKRLPQRTRSRHATSE